MDRSLPEFLSIADENGPSNSYGTGQTVAPSSNFDNLQLIFDCDIDDSKAKNGGDHGATNDEAPRLASDVIAHNSVQSSYSGSSQPELPICQSYSDLEESIAPSSKKNQFLLWFAKRFILLNSDGQLTQASHQPETCWRLNYQEGAIYLQEGLNNDKFEFHPSAFKKLPAYLTTHSHLYYLIDLAACLLILSLAIFEKPAVDGFHLSEWIHALMELIGLAIISFIFWIKFQWMGCRHILRHKRTMIKTCVLLLMIIEAIVVLLRGDSHFRVTRSLRPVFLIDNYYFGGVRRVIRQTIQSLGSFFQMLLLQMFFLVFFSISAFYLFASIPNYEQFSTIWDSFISLYIALSTSNYPDVMMPAYKQSQLYVLFFVCFLTVNLYFLLNIMLAVVYTKFSQIEKDKFRKLLLHRRKACEKAFELLLTNNNAEYIEFPRFCGLLQFLKPNTSLLERYLMYKALLDDNFDCDESRVNSPSKSHQQHYLTLNKFYKIYEVLNLKWRGETRYMPWFENAPYTRVFRGLLYKLHFLVTHSYFKFYIYFILLLATTYQLIDAIVGYEKWQEEVGLPTSSTTVCAFFIGLYTVEMCLKMLALGVREYFQRRWNCFDFVITVFALATFLLTQYQITQSLSTSFFSLRSLRLIELLQLYVRRYRDILGPFAFIIVKRFISVLLVVLIVYYFFAILAMELFGGYQMLDCCKNTSIEAYYDSSGTGQYFYYLNNFNDIVTSFITLFELMIVNNWPVIMKSYVIVTGTQVTSLFFMIFFMISLLVVSIVIAFVIDTIQFQIKYQDRFGQDTLSAKIRVNIQLSNEEFDWIVSHSNMHSSRSNNDGATSTLTRRLLSTPFPPSWSFLKMIFRGQNFDRMNDSFSSSLNNLVLPPNTNAINLSSDEILTVSEPGSALFRGTRFRDKFSYNLRMYSDEIQKWIQ